MAVPEDSSVDGVSQEVPIGPRKVFKTGYPTTKTVGVEGSTRGSHMSRIELNAHKQTDVLRTHGVADAARVQLILHPKDLSVVASLSSQKAYLVTDDFKVIDVASYEWPIDLDSAVDVRATINSPVQYGERIGIVAGCHEENVLVRVGKDTLTVALHDLDPVMAESATNMMWNALDQFSDREVELNLKDGVYRPVGDKDVEILRSLSLPLSFPPEQFDEISERLGVEEYGTLVNDLDGGVDAQ